MIAREKGVAFVGAIVRAALSEPGGEVELDALDCAISISRAIRESHEGCVEDILGSLLRLDLPGSLPPACQGVSSCAAPGFAARFVEFKFRAALSSSRDDQLCPHGCLHRVCSHGCLHQVFLEVLFAHPDLPRLESVISRHLPLFTPVAADLFRRLMAEHGAVRQSCELAFRVLRERGPTPRMSASAFVLGVNLGFVSLDLDSFGMLVHGVLHGGYSLISAHCLQALVQLSEMLAAVSSTSLSSSPPAPPRLHFNRPGIISCTDWHLDRLIDNVLDRSMGSRASSAIMGNLLRCRRFAAHDPRHAAFRIANRPAHMFKNNNTSGAEIEFCIEWMRSELLRASRLGTASGGATVLRLFRNSTPATAPQAWTLLLMLRNVCGMDARSLGGLSGIYHPSMTSAAIRCLVWNHPLAATHMIHIRERHYRLCVELVRRGQVTSDARLAEAAAVARLVRCVGGPGMSLLFGSALPLRANTTVKDFLM